MTKENKELLLKDLCARLPYNTTKVRWYKYRSDPKGYVDTILNQLLLDTDKGEVYCKPYLRPISSITEEERKEYNALFTIHSDGESYCENWEWIDWMNAHHFDYRGLIEKGLALEAPIDMYKFE